MEGTCNNATVLPMPSAVREAAMKPNLCWYSRDRHQAAAPSQKETWDSSPYLQQDMHQDLSGVQMGIMAPRAAPSFRQRSCPNNSASQQKSCPQRRKYQNLISKMAHRAGSSKHCEPAVPSASKEDKQEDECQGKDKAEQWHSLDPLPMSPHPQISTSVLRAKLR